MRLTVTTSTPVVEGVTLELTLAEARALLRVIGAPSEEMVADALLRSGESVYVLRSKLAKALA